MPHEHNAAKDERAAGLQFAPPNDSGHGPVRPPRDDEFLHQVAPSRQKFAQAFLDGKSPGIMQRYAPEAETSEVEGWVEGDETVQRLVRWREEMIQ